MYTYQTTTDSVHIFTDTDGNSYKVGIGVGTWQEALELLENPPAPPEPPSFTPTGKAYALDLSSSAQSEFTKQFAFVTGKLSLGSMQNSDTMAIADINGNLHSMTVGEYVGIMIEYGDYVYNQWLQSKLNG